VKEINVIGKQVVEGVAEYKRQTLHCVGAFFVLLLISNYTPRYQLHLLFSLFLFLL
jgi:hypothetical protein